MEKAPVQAVTTNSDYSYSEQNTIGLYANSPRGSGEEAKQIALAEGESCTRVYKACSEEAVTAIVVLLGLTNRGEQRKRSLIS